MERNLQIIKTLGLIKQCPSGKPLAGCPFKKIAGRFGLRDAFRLITSLSDEDIDLLLDKHLDCYNKRPDSIQYNVNRNYFEVS